MGEIIKTRLQKSECLCHFFSFLLNNMSGMTTLKKSFLSGDSNSNSQKCDYRQYIINLNAEFVRSLHTVDLAKNRPTEPVGHLTIRDNEVTATI